MKVIKNFEIDKGPLFSVLVTGECLQFGFARIPVNQCLPQTGVSKHPTEEICIVMKGSIRVETPEGIEYLNAGDISFMPEDVEHRNVNVGDTEVEMFWYTAPPTVV
ncbi:MAG: cupin domain-containing protein [Caulobacteraceae bacterium]